MPRQHLHTLASLDARCLRRLLRHLAHEPRRGRPWSASLGRRLLVTCAALRTNLTFRELAAVFGISKSAAHRMVAAITPRLAAIATQVSPDRRWSWVVDGTLVPTRDHTRAARSKNYRWSCNARDLKVIASVAGGPGNRNDPFHYRGSSIQTLCQVHGRVLADGGYRGVPELVTPTFRGRRMVRDRAWRSHRRRRARVEHAIARLKDWRVLRDHRRRGQHLATTLQAVVVLHNLKHDLCDKS